jgi:Histidine kinase-, DNA gyrase B-, and HSP90-like ATPase
MGNRSDDDERLSLRQIVDSTPALIHTARPGNGSGVGDPERIFEPYLTTKQKDMGIGLAVSCSIVEAHGGRLWAENNVDGGATFSVVLPLSSVSENPNAECCSQFGTQPGTRGSVHRKCITPAGGFLARFGGSESKEGSRTDAAITQYLGAMKDSTQLRE